jgi:5'-methylthioadenosine phosphorylase
VIGGSGVYELKDTKVVREIDADTPFGKPSDKIVVAKVGEREVAFLPRHGRGHRFLPSEVPSRANVYALKSLGVEKIVSVSAVGSLKEEVRPTDVLLPNQLIDRTQARPSSFYGNGIVGHVSMADPFCEEMRAQVASIIRETLAKTDSAKRLIDGGTYVCIEGPQFSTRAESNLYRSWDASVVGMTAIPEAKLAREAEMCYVTLAMVTDYDCWKESEEDVGVSMVLHYMEENNKTIRAVLPEILTKLPLDRKCACRNAAEFAVMTAPQSITPEAKKHLELLFGKYWNGGK